MHVATIWFDYILLCGTHFNIDLQSIIDCMPKPSDTLPLENADDAIRVYNVEGGHSAHSPPVLF